MLNSKKKPLIYLGPLYLRCKCKYIQQKLKMPKYYRIEYEQCKIVISSEVLCIFIKFTLWPKLIGFSPFSIIFKKRCQILISSYCDLLTLWTSGVNEKGHVTPVIYGSLDCSGENEVSGIVKLKMIWAGSRIILYVLMRYSRIGIFPNEEMQICGYLQHIETVTFQLMDDSQ